MKTFKTKLKEGTEVTVDEAYLNDEASPEGASSTATVFQEPTDKEMLVGIKYEDGSLDYVPQDILTVMTNTKKYYKTVIQMEVLSEEPIGDADMQTILHQTTDGDWSGKNTTIVQDEALSGKQMADALREQGSDPEFFQLDEDGNEIE